MKISGRILIRFDISIDEGFLAQTGRMNVRECKQNLCKVFVISCFHIDFLPLRDGSFAVLPDPFAGCIVRFSANASESCPEGRTLIISITHISA